jgi:hypothetical protein
MSTAEERTKALTAKIWDSVVYNKGSIYAIEQRLRERVKELEQEGGGG